MSPLSLTAKAAVEVSGEQLLRSRDVVLDGSCVKEDGERPHWGMHSDGRAPGHPASRSVRYAPDDCRIPATIDMDPPASDDGRRHGRTTPDPDGLCGGWSRAASSPPLAAALRLPMFDRARATPQEERVIETS